MGRNVKKVKVKPRTYTVLLRVTSLLISIKEEVLKREREKEAVVCLGMKAGGGRGKASHLKKYITTSHRLKKKKNK